MLFKKYDKTKSGTVSSIEFRNVMRKLDIGLTSRDID